MYSRKKATHMIVGRLSSLNGYIGAQTPNGADCLNPMRVYDILRECRDIMGHVRGGAFCTLRTPIGRMMEYSIRREWSVVRSHVVQIYEAMLREYAK